MAAILNPIIRGWIRYYGKFYRSALTTVFLHLNDHLVRWVVRKYKRFTQRKRKAREWLGRVAQREPHLFVHWSELGGVTPAAG